VVVLSQATTTIILGWEVIINKVVKGLLQQLVTSKA